MNRPTPTLPQIIFAIPPNNKYLQSLKAPLQYSSNQLILFNFLAHHFFQSSSFPFSPCFQHPSRMKLNIRKDRGRNEKLAPFSNNLDESANSGRGPP